MIPMDAKRVGLYARISTKGKGQTVDTQLLDLRRYSESRGWRIITECIDEGISGSKESRPALKQIMDLARKRKIDVLFVHRFDRLFRSLKHLINTLEELNELGVHFVSFSESLDTSTAQGKLVFSMVSAISEFERSLIIERVNAGLRRARAQGKRLGRPPKPFNVQEARTLRTKGQTFVAIGRLFGISRESVRMALQKTPAENQGLAPTKSARI
jgi:DNA invertase Pin-like site-specific DNA recombinase